MSEEFRFATKKEYEEELQMLLARLSKKLSNRSREKILEEYDQLIEEYMKFCSEKRDGR